MKLLHARGTNFFKQVVAFPPQRRTIMMENEPEVRPISIEFPETVFIMEVEKQDDEFLFMEFQFGHPKGDKIYPIPLPNIDGPLTVCLPHNFQPGTVNINKLIDLFWQTSFFDYENHTELTDECFDNEFNELVAGKYTPKNKITVCELDDLYIEAIDSPEKEGYVEVETKLIRANYL